MLSNQENEDNDNELLALPDASSTGHEKGSTLDASPKPQPEVEPTTTDAAEPAHAGAQVSSGTQCIVVGSAALTRPVAEHATTKGVFEHPTGSHIKVAPTAITISHQPNAAGKPWSLRLVRGFEHMVELFDTEAAALERKAFHETLLKFGIDPFASARVDQTVVCVGLEGQDTYELVVRGLRVVQANAKIDPAATVNDAIDLRLAEAREDPDLKDYENLVSKFAAIQKGIGSLRALSLRTETVVAFLNNLMDHKRRVGFASAHTKDHYAELLQSALCALGMDNPLPDLPHFEIPGPVEFFTLEEVKTIFAITPTRARGFIAVALLAFIRPELLARLPACCVNIEKRTITIPKDLSKNDKRHALKGDIVFADGSGIAGLVDVLWEVLRIYPFEPVPWEPLREYLAGFLGKWIHDGLRRTGATFYKAIYGRAATVKMLLHSSGQTTSRHYIGTATRQQGLDFMALALSALSFPPETQWIVAIPQEELKRIVQLKPIADLARDLNVGEAALVNLCKKHEVDVRPGEYWDGRGYSSAKVVINWGTTAPHAA